MNVLTIFLLAVATSLDNLGVGIFYGMRRIRVPMLSNLAISGISAATTWLAMVFGQFTATFCSLRVARTMGAIIIICLGIWALVQSWRPGSEDNAKNMGGKEPVEPVKLTDIYIRPLGLMITILKEPSRVDLDYSGSVDLKESLVLGIALALNAIAGGFGVSLAGYNPVVTSIAIGVVSYLSLAGGAYLAHKYASACWGDWASKIAGGLLVLIGFYELF